MAELHDLKPSPGSHRPRKRVGRGPGSGSGKTSGRGQKGQKARSGGSVRPGFEGGQMPLHRRIPKRGFTPLNRTEYQVVNVRDLEEVEADAITPRVLREAGLIGSMKKLVKILGTGEIARAVKVEAHAFSDSARAKIEAAGGSVTIVTSQDKA
jgi:large subunit ribosomal protein L15